MLMKKINPQRHKRNNMKKKVQDLQRGDKVQSGAGAILTVHSLDHGWSANSSFINYTNGEWSCLCNNDTVETLKA